MVGKREYVTGAGDSLHFLETTPHGRFNKAANLARLIWIGRIQHGKFGEITSSRVGSS
jgi:hypothetical protein